MCMEYTERYRLYNIRSFSTFFFTTVYRTHAQVYIFIQSMFAHIEEEKKFRAKFHLSLMSSFCSCNSLTAFDVTWAVMEQRADEEGVPILTVYIYIACAVDINISYVARMYSYVHMYVLPVCSLHCNFSIAHFIQQLLYRTESVQTICALLDTHI